jgi:hypothetical protein
MVFVRPEIQNLKLNGIYSPMLKHKENEAFTFKILNKFSDKGGNLNKTRFWASKEYSLI